MPLLQLYGYCIDSSALIDLKKYYPETFKAFWRDLDKLVTNGEIITPKEVFEELKAYRGKNDEILDWVKKHEKIMVIALDIPQQLEVKLILGKYPNLVDINKTTPEGDPYVIALAKTDNRTVVCAESFWNLNDLTKIPAVCNELKVRCIPLRQLFKEKNLSY